MQRKKELSFMNVIFCLLVIFIHVSSASIGSYEKGSLAYGLFFVPWRLSAFVVQGFIFLSGIKMFLKNDNSGYIKFCIKKLKTIVIPYVLAVVAFYYYFLQKDYFAFDIKAFFGYIIKGDLVAHFYFVIIIVQFYFLKPFWKLLTDKVSPKTAILLSVLITLLSKYFLSGFVYVDRIFITYIPYWIAGSYVGIYYDKVLAHIKKHKAIYIFQFLPIAIIEAVFSYIGFVYGKIKYLEGLHFVYCVSAIMFMFAVSTVFAKSVMKIKIFEKIDNAGYFIYLIHPLFIFIADEYLVKWGVESIAKGFAVRSVLTYALSIFVPVLYLESKKILQKLKNNDII